MSDPFEQHLYVILWPNYALVASNLAPDEFGKHYTLGSSRYFHGQVIFGEIDSSYRHDYFDLDTLMKEVVPNEAGRPKRTKFIRSYRVLEHVELSAFKDLHVTSVTGKVLTLQAKEYDVKHKKGYIRCFQEVCPFSHTLLSYMTPPEFGEYITASDQPKGAPKVAFTQIEFDIAEFFQLLDEDPFHTSPLPNVHPHKLRDQILELQATPEKRLKGISLDSALNRISFLSLRRGFWIAAPGELLYYPYPDAHTLEKENYDFFRDLQGGSR